MLIPVASNRLDVLAHDLARRLNCGSTRDGRPVDLFDDTPVLVASLGVGDWLRRRLAHETGLASNLEITFLARWVWQQIERRFPDVRAAAPVPGLRLRWQVFNWLHRNAVQWPVLAPLCEQDRSRWKLSGQIAGLLAEYLVYRPDWLSAWSEGRQPKDWGDGILGALSHAQWQAALWRDVARDLGLTDSIHPLLRYADELDRMPGDLPPRVVLFALPNVAPLYAEFLGRLAAHCELIWYRLAPSDAALATWTRTDSSLGSGQPVPTTLGDPTAPTEAAAEASLRYFTAEASALHRSLELSSERAAGLAADPSAGFVEPLGLRGLPGATDHGASDEAAQRRPVPRLVRLQQAWFEVGTSTARQIPLPAAPGSSADDDSLLIHACTSVLRQVEVLADALEARFLADPTLRADQVLVLCTDPGAYAGAIDAVFGGRGLLPYRMAGVEPPHEAEYDTLLAELMALPSHRFEAEELFAWLECDAIAATFGLTPSDVTLLRSALQDEAGAVWARNGRQRAACGLPPVERHAWSWAVGRLLLGSAVCVDALGADAIAGIPPAPWPPRQVDVHALGRLLVFLARCEHWAHRLAQPKTPAQWADQLREMLDDFFAPQPADQRVVAWRRHIEHDIDELAFHASSGLAATLSTSQAADGAFAVDVIAAFLAERSAARVPAARPAPVISVTRLGELRGVPFRIVAVLGLEADVFPAADVRLEFDLLRWAPRLGDRSPRAEQLGAMLEALLAAEDACWLFYNGRDPQTYDEWPVALPVAELEAVLEALEQPVATGSQAPWRRSHALLPAPVLAAVKREGGPAACSAPPSSNATRGRFRIDIARLAAFVAAPAGSFLRDHLGLARLDADDVEPGSQAAGVEPVSLAGLAKWRLGSRLIARLANEPQADAEQLLHWLRDAPELAPQAAWPVEELRSMVAKAQGYMQVWHAWHRKPRQFMGISADIPKLGWTVQGSIDTAGQSAPGTVLLARFSTLKLRDVAAAGVLRCVLDLSQAAAGRDEPAPTVRLLASDGLWEWSPLPVACAAQQLETWIGHYIEQAEQRDWPWPLPARTTLAYLNGRYPQVKSGKAGKAGLAADSAHAEHRALAAAAQEWKSEREQLPWRWLLRARPGAAGHGHDEQLPPSPWPKLVDEWYGQWFALGRPIDAATAAIEDEATPINSAGGS